MTISFKGSPNFDTNRKTIDRVCIHWFGMGTLEGASATFQKPGGTSAHYGISDNTVYQWVKEEHVAYHAGNYAMNQRSIGIEHDANPNKPLSDASYKTSGELIKRICTKYNIPIDRTHIIKHSEIKATQCPGSIDLDKLIAIAKGSSMSGLPANYGDIIHASVQWEEVCKTLELGEPKSAVAQQVINTIGGYKSRITVLENEAGKNQAEINNRIEQVSRLNVELLKLGQQRDLADNQLKMTTTQLNEMAKAKGSIAIELETAKKTIETLKSQATNSGVTLTIGDIIKLIFSQKVTLYAKK